MFKKLDAVAFPNDDINYDDIDSETVTFLRHGSCYYGP